MLPAQWAGSLFEGRMDCGFADRMAASRPGMERLFPKAEVGRPKLFVEFSLLVENTLWIQDPRRDCLWHARNRRLQLRKLSGIL